MDVVKNPGSLGPGAPALLRTPVARSTVKGSEAGARSWRRITADARCLLHGLYRLIVQDDQLVPRNACGRVGSSLIVAELDFKGVGRKLLGDSAYLASHEPMFRQIFS